MPAEAHQTPAEPWRLDGPEVVALAYHRASGGDAWTALVAMARDALADLDNAETVIRERGRQLSHGYVRAALTDAAALP